MNINQMPYRSIRPQTAATKIVISISSQLLADGLKSMLGQRGYEVEVFNKNVNFESVSRQLLSSDRGEQTVWMLDMQALLALVPSTKREMIRNRAILISDLNPGRKSGAYLADAAAIVSTESSFQELEFAVRAVAQGNRYFDQRLSHFRVEEFNGISPNLTARQLQVLRMVADGMSSRKIANELLLSRRTVENHRARILERLGVNTAAEMIDIARNKNWI